MVQTTEKAVGSRPDSSANPRLLDVGGEQVPISFEVSAPQTQASVEQFRYAVASLSQLDPSFLTIANISTVAGMNHDGGSTAGRSSKSALEVCVDGLLHESDPQRIMPQAYFGPTFGYIEEELRLYQGRGIGQLLVKPPDWDLRSGLPSRTICSDDHTRRIIDIAKNIGFSSFGVLIRPEELEYRNDEQARVLDMADFAITQLFFESESYGQLVDDMQKRGVEKPIIPGVMPFKDPSKARRVADATGVKFDETQIGRSDGIQSSATLIRELIEEGAPGINLYTFNDARLALQVVDSL